MNPTNEEAGDTPMSPAPEAEANHNPDSLAGEQPGCPLHRTAAECAQVDLEALEFEEALGEPALARVSRILRRTDVAPGSTIYRFPTYAPESLAYHELVAFSRDKRLPGALLRLHKRGAV